MKRKGEKRKTELTKANIWIEIISVCTMPHPISVSLVFSTYVEILIRSPYAVLQFHLFSDPILA